MTQDYQEVACARAGAGAKSSGDQCICWYFFTAFSQSLLKVSKKFSLRTKCVFTLQGKLDLAN